MMQMARFWLYLPAAIVLLNTASFASPFPFPGDKEFAGICYPEAVHVYDSLLSRSPHDPQALWRLARVYLCMADIAPDREEEALYRQAEVFARQCIAADSTVAEGHSWLAAALGSIAMFEGGKRKVQLCSEIKRELDVAIALDPSNDVAYSILGSFYRALGNISWFERRLANIFLGTLPEGGAAEAEIALKHAIELAPNVMRHRYELGVLYQETDRPTEAQKQFEMVTTLPVLLARDQHTLVQARARAEALAAK